MHNSVIVIWLLCSLRLLGNDLRHVDHCSLYCRHAQSVPLHRSDVWSWFAVFALFVVMVGRVMTRTSGKCNVKLCAPTLFPYKCRSYTPLAIQINDTCVCEGNMPSFDILHSWQEYMLGSSVGSVLNCAYGIGGRQRVKCVPPMSPN